MSSNPVPIPVPMSQVQRRVVFGADRDIDRLDHAFDVRGIPAEGDAADDAVMVYAGDTHCLPGSLTVGTALGVAYHFGDADSVIADAVMLMP